MRDRNKARGELNDRLYRERNGIIAFCKTKYDSSTCRPNESCSPQYKQIDMRLLDLSRLDGYNRTVGFALEMLTPTALAFIGDAAHTLYIRRRIVESGYASGTMHIAATKFVNATAQAAAFDEFMARDAFTEQELDIARRAKNAHLHSRAKSATPSDYHKATALEAVIGYLELSGENGRKNVLLELYAEVSGLDEFLKRDI